MFPRPSHATIVAYLALFVALAGGAYAATKVTSAEIENKTIKGKDVKPDALKGKQIKETKLAKVPSAAAADAAASADLLDGLDSTRFLRTDAIRVGVADETATTPQTILAYPALGIQLETDGDGDDDRVISLRNTRASGEIIRVGATALGGTIVGPGDAGGNQTTPGRVTDFVVGVVDDDRQAVHFNCAHFSGGTVRCIGIDIAP